MIVILALLVYVLSLTTIIIIQYLFLKTMERGVVVQVHLIPPEHPNCRCIIEPQENKPCAWMNSGPGHTIDFEAIPIKTGHDHPRE